MASRWIKALFLTSTLFTSVTALSATEDIPLDTWHQRISSWTQTLGSWLDARLAGLEHPPPNNRSWMKLGIRQQYSRLSTAATTPVVDLRLYLPHAEKRWGLVIQAETPREAATLTETENQPPVQPAAQERATLIGVRFTDRATARLLRQVTLGGILRDGQAGIAIQWRNRDHYPLYGRWSRKDTQALIWETLTGWRGSLRFDLDYTASVRRLWRLSADMTGYLDTELIELTFSNTLFAWQPQHTSITGQLYGRWNNQPWGLHQWGPRLSWSRPLIRRWMLFTLTPEIRFNRTAGYAADPALTLSWTAVFNR